MVDFLKEELLVNERRKSHHVKKKLTTAEINQASAVSIMDYFSNQGIGQVVNEGPRYVKVSIKEHDSIVIDKQNNYFVHNSNPYEKLAKGNAINFIRYFEDCTFQEAVEKLLAFGENREYIPSVIEKERFKYDVVKAKYNSRAYTYLTKGRGLSKQLVKRLFEEGYLTQDTRNNVVFNWTEDGLPPKDDPDKIVGATIALTQPKEGQLKKWIMANSKGNWGFNIRTGPHPRKIYVFEAAIDLLSYLDLHRNQLQDAWLIEMEGLKEQTLHNFLTEAGMLNSSESQQPDYDLDVQLCVDNDLAGHRFLDNVMRPTDSSKMTYTENVPYQRSVTRDEESRLQRLASELRLPISFVTAVYLAERPYELAKLDDIQERDALFISNPIRYPELVERYYAIKEGTADKLWGFDKEHPLYNKFLEREKRFSDYYYNTNYPIVEEIRKDWNDYLLYGSSTKEPYLTENRENVKLNSENSRPTLEGFEKYIQANTRRLTDKDIVLFMEDSGLNRRVIESFNDKGWLRKDIKSGELYILWSRNGNVVGGEIISQYSSPTRVVELDKSTHQRESFIYTVGHPEEVRVFSSPQESLAYLDLHPNQKNYVAICDNQDERYIARKVQAYAQQSDIQKVIDCRTHSKDSYSLSDSLSIIVGMSALTQLAIDSYAPISASWNRDLSNFNHYKVLEIGKDLQKFYSITTTTPNLSKLNQTLSL